jgi:hypothetical protein
MSRPIRQRSITALVLITCLLFQQVAMAALACTMTQMPVNPTAMAHDCEAMASKQVHQADSVCQKHYAPDPTSANTSSIPAVPPLALPPLLHALTLAPVTRSCVYGSGEVFAHSDPPTRLRYCRLLI